MSENREPLYTSRNGAVAPDEVIHEPLATGIDPDEFTPRLLTLLSNALGWAQSQRLRAELDATPNDWRVLSALATTPGQSASEICVSTSINKSAISMAVNRLAQSGLIVFVDGPRGSRAMYLTRLGARMHDRMVPVVQRGQAAIAEELDSAELREFNALLRRLLNRARTLSNPAD